MISLQAVTLGLGVLVCVVLLVYMVHSYWIAKTPANKVLKNLPAELVGMLCGVVLLASITSIINLINT